MACLPTWIKDYIGIPFVSGGRKPETGLDCYGLFRCVQNTHYGKHLPPLCCEYEDACDTEQTAQVYRMHQPLIAGERLASPVDGCGVVIKYDGMPTHLGVYVGGYILHTTRRTGCVMESIDSPNLKCRIEGYYAVKN